MENEKYGVDFETWDSLSEEDRDAYRSIGSEENYSTEAPEEEDDGL